MPAHVILVHDKPEFLARIGAALRFAGYDVAAFCDPLAALDGLEKARQAELLITRIKFAVGMPHGISLASMARYKRPKINVLLVDDPKEACHAEGVGAFIPCPIEIPRLLTTLDQLVGNAGRPAQNLAPNLVRSDDARCAGGLC